MERIQLVVYIFLVGLVSPMAWAYPASVAFSQPPAQIDRFEFVEITASIQAPDTQNPFRDVALSGKLETEDGSHSWNVEGFCDASDGSIFRIRFMPPISGRFKYTVTYKQGSYTQSASGK